MGTIATVLRRRRRGERWRRGMAHFVLEWYNQAYIKGVIVMMGRLCIEGHTGAGFHNTVGLPAVRLRSGLVYIFLAANAHCVQKKGPRRAARGRRLDRATS